MSRVVEGFYVRFFWDWLAFISGAFRWKVFAVFADDVGETSPLSSHAALLTPCPIAINAALDTVVNIRRGLMNGRQISSMEPLLFPFFSSPVDGSIKLIRPSVMMRTSSILSRALLNHPTDISSGTSITTVCRCCMHCSAAFSTHGLILLYGGLYVLIADGCAYLDGAESATNARRKDNNNPRIRGDFFYLNSLRRVLFYGDDYDLFNIQPSNVTEIPARP